jgi:hypothetical protein
MACLCKILFMGLGRSGKRTFRGRRLHYLEKLQCTNWLEFLCNYLAIALHQKGAGYGLQTTKAQGGEPTCTF